MTREEGRVKRRLVTVKVLHKTPVRGEAKRNPASTLNMDEEPPVPHQPNVPAATRHINNQLHVHSHMPLVPDMCVQNNFKLTFVTGGRDCLSFGSRDV